MRKLHRKLLLALSFGISGCNQAGSEEADDPRSFFDVPHWAIEFVRNGNCRVDMEVQNTTSATLRAGFRSDLKFKGSIVSRHYILPYHLLLEPGQTVEMQDTFPCPMATSADLVALVGESDTLIASALLAP